MIPKEKVNVETVFIRLFRLSTNLSRKATVSSQKIAENLDKSITMDIVFLQTTEAFIVIEELA